MFWKVSLTLLVAGQKSKEITLSNSNLLLVRRTKEKQKPPQNQWSDPWDTSKVPSASLTVFTTVNTRRKQKGGGPVPCNDFYSQRSSIKKQRGPSQFKFQNLWAHRIALSHAGLILISLWPWLEIWVHFLVPLWNASIFLQGKGYPHSFQKPPLLLKVYLCMRVPQREKRYQFKR